MPRKRKTHEVLPETIVANAHGDTRKITFANRLNELLTKKNVTQEKLATDTDISIGAISEYRTGKKLPNSEYLARIAERLEVPTDYLLGLTEAAAVEPELQEICDYIGFSYKGIERLLTWKKELKKVENEDGTTTITAFNKDGTPFVIRDPRLAMNFDVHRKIAYFDEEMEAINFLLEYGIDFGFFRELYEYLQDVEYFSENENNPTHAGDTLMSNFYNHISNLAEPERIMNKSVMLVSAFVNGKETKKRIDLESLRDMHKLRIMEILSELRKVKEKEAQNAEH